MNFDPINIFGTSNSNNNNNTNNGNSDFNNMAIADTVDTADTADTASTTAFGDALSYKCPITAPRRRRMFDFGGFGGFGGGEEGGGGGGLQQHQQQQQQQQQHQQQHQQQEESPDPSSNSSRNGNIDVVKSEKVAVDELLSNELLKLSLNDRTAIDEEIHGVTCLSPNESPEFLSRSLWAFQNEIDNANSSIPYQKKKVYHDILNRVSWRRRQQQQQQQQQQLNNTNTNTNTNTNIGQQQQGQGQGQGQQSNHNMNTILIEKHYVIDDINFRLRFLRCELFDIRKSVLRFLHYLNFINDLWGFDIVSQNTQIGIKDFTKSELKLFKRGLFQILPFRDRSGRRVIVIMGGMGSTNTLVARAKSYFYIWDVATRDSVESQRKGAISITHQSAWTSGITTSSSSSSTAAAANNEATATDGSSSDNSSGSGSGSASASRKNTKTNTGSFQVPHKELKMVNDLFAAIPTRITANHNLYPDTPIYRFISKLIMVSVVSGSTQRLRQKFHFGDEIELRYQLQGFGIPINLIPSTETGTVKLHNFNQWMKTRQIVEENPNDNNQYTYNVTNNNSTGSTPKKTKITTTTTVTNFIVECPGTNDVIFRRGQSFKEHPGNDMFRDSILNFLTEKDNEVTSSSSSAAAYKDNNNNNNNININININDVNSTNNHNTATSIMVSADDSTSTSTSTSTTKDNGNNNIDNNNNNNNKDRDELFCNWLLHEIHDQRGGRFLEWDQDLNSWIQMFDSMKIKRKISVSLYNYEKRYSSSIIRRQAHHQRLHVLTSTSASASASASASTTNATAAKTNSAQQHHGHQQQASVTPGASAFAATNTFNSGNNNNDYNSDDIDGGGGGGINNSSMAYCFIEGGEPSSQKHNQAQNCCAIRFDNCSNPHQHQHQHQHQHPQEQQQQHHDGSNKKARTHSFSE